MTTNTNSDSPLDAVWIGDGGDADFSEALATLQDATRFDDLPSALADPRARRARLLVLAQNRRGQFNSVDAGALRALAPQAYPINLLSSWCEGESRSGTPLAGWNRVIWYRWPAEFARFQAGDPSVWQVSIGESANGRQLERSRWMPGGRCRVLGVWGRQNHRSQTVCDALQWLGHQPQDLGASAELSDEVASRLSGCVLAADSLDPWLQSLVDTLRRYRRFERFAVMLNFPRQYEVSWLQRKLGQRFSLIGQPFDLYELQRALD